MTFGLHKLRHHSLHEYGEIYCIKCVSWQVQKRVYCLLYIPPPTPSLSPRGHPCTIPNPTCRAAGCQGGILCILDNEVNATQTSDAKVEPTGCVSKIPLTSSSFISFISNMAHTLQLRRPPPSVLSILERKRVLSVF